MNNVSSHALHNELRQVTIIESSRSFLRLGGVTQVKPPIGGPHVFFRNRQSHSQEVATSTQFLGHALALHHGVNYSDLDYFGSLRAAALSHDLGLPPLAHDGAKILSNKFVRYGLEEGFSDNDQVLVVIEKSLPDLDLYTKLSTIKYPDKMYPYLRETYIPLLLDAIHADIERLSTARVNISGFTRTLACEIMDTADRNTYITSGLRDHLCNGETLPVHQVMNLAEAAQVSGDPDFDRFVGVLRSAKRADIEKFFNELRFRFNSNYELHTSGLIPLDADLHLFREFLWDVEFEYTIKPQRTDPVHIHRMKCLEQMIYEVVEKGLCTSRHYQSILEKADNLTDILRAKRDMISQMTDWFVLERYAGQDLESLPGSPDRWLCLSLLDETYPTAG